MNVFAFVFFFYLLKYGLLDYEHLIKEHSDSQNHRHPHDKDEGSHHSDSFLPIYTKDIFNYLYGTSLAAQQLVIPLVHFKDGSLVGKSPSVAYLPVFQMPDNPFPAPDQSVHAKSKTINQLSTKTLPETTTLKIIETTQTVEPKPEQKVQTVSADTASMKGLPIPGYKENYKPTRNKIHIGPKVQDISMLPSDSKKFSTIGPTNKILVHPKERLIIGETTPTVNVHPSTEKQKEVSHTTEKIYDQNYKVSIHVPHHPTETHDNKHKEHHNGNKHGAHHHNHHKGHHNHHHLASENVHVHYKHPINKSSVNETHGPLSPELEKICPDFLTPLERRLCIELASNHKISKTQKIAIINQLQRERISRYAIDQCQYRGRDCRTCLMDMKCAYCPADNRCYGYSLAFKALTDKSVCSGYSPNYFMTCILESNKIFGYIFLLCFLFLAMIVAIIVLSFFVFRNRNKGKKLVLNSEDFDNY